MQILYVPCDVYLVLLLLLLLLLSVPTGIIGGDFSLRPSSPTCLFIMADVT
jgi:hypothetical protein